MNKKHSHKKQTTKKTTKPLIKKCTSFWRFVMYEFIIVVLAIILINVYVLSFSVLEYFSHIRDIEPTEVGLVLGASVKPDGTPSDILKDRLDTSIIFYKEGKIQKILVSGDNSTHNYNEPVAMQKYLLSMGVPKDDVYLDYAGFDTYDSLYRARDIFGSSNLVIFTQGFHLHRVIYIAKRLDMNVVGVTTDIRKYLDSNRNSIREIFARVKAFFEVEFLKPQPKYLGDPVEIVSDDKVDKLKADILGN